MTNPAVVISGVGLWTPDHIVSNAELVESYNAFAEKYNAEHAEAIVAGEWKRNLSLNGVHRKASGIKSRYVYVKDGILDQAEHAANSSARGNAISDQAEVAVIAAVVMAAANKSAADIDAVIVSCTTHSDTIQPLPSKCSMSLV